MPEKAEVPPMGGLSSSHAIAKLISGIEATLANERAERPISWKLILFEALTPKNTYSLFPITSLVSGVVFSVLLLIGTSFEPGYWPSALTIVLSVILNFFLAVYEQWQKRRERRQRVHHVVLRLRQVNDHLHWSSSNYPHLHTPPAASIVLQWAIRDRKQVNLPWALLVEHDLVLLKPGQSAPGRCHGVADPEIVLQKGDLYKVENSSWNDDSKDSKKRRMDKEQQEIDEAISPVPEFKEPAKPQLFILDETPYLSVIREYLKNGEEIGREKPALLPAKYANLFFVRTSVHCLMPIFYALSLIWNIVRYRYSWSKFGPFQEESFVHFHVFEPLTVILPLLPLTFQLIWILTNHAGLAWFLGVYKSSRHVKVTDDPFDDNISEPDLNTAPNKVSWSTMKDYVKSSLAGKGEYLIRTENVIHTLGTITAFCCSDKKGILSWPNATPEKLFILKRGENSNKGILIPEILNITHDPHNPSNVEFDDPNWKRYLDHLKPLGLAIVLNTCNVQTEEKYTNFYNHLICESRSVE